VEKIKFSGIEQVSSGKTKYFSANDILFSDFYYKSAINKFIQRLNNNYTSKCVTLHRPFEWGIE